MPKRTYPRIEAGTKYGRLTIIEYSHTDKHKKPIYKTVCDCGTEILVAGRAMMSGNTSSCGCLRKENRAEIGKKNYKDLLGQTFGKLTVVSREGSSHRGALWNCSCECGNTKIMPTSLLTQGTKSCGCLLGKSKACVKAKAKRSRLKREELVNLPDELRPRVKRTDGYVTISGMYHHPNANSRGVIKEHRYVMAQKLGRPLLDNENVHHINGIRSDNRPENLELWTKFQPPGQRVEDLVEYAKKLLAIYSPKSLNNDPMFANALTETIGKV
jgi:hypothetical protein